MSDAQKLKDCIAEYRKANKDLNDKLKTAEQNIRDRRKTTEDLSSRRD
ncbi:unnamed protein product [marine sediment metagenome]|uniref:Uncharacterized protein n=1 Tax=marine sediment metagenome TaxID=412755 RepID=X1PKA5_9ZZZZ